MSIVVFFFKNSDSLNVIYYIRNSKIEKAVQSYKKNILNSIPPPVHHYDFYFLLTLTSIYFQDCKVFHSVFVVIR